MSKTFDLVVSRIREFTDNKLAELDNICEDHRRWLQAAVAEVKQQAAARLPQAKRQKLQMGTAGQAIASAPSRGRSRRGRAAIQALETVNEEEEGDDEAEEDAVQRHCVPPLAIATAIEPDSTKPRTRRRRNQPERIDAPLPTNSGGIEKASADTETLAPQNFNARQTRARNRAAAGKVSKVASESAAGQPAAHTSVEDSQRTAEQKPRRGRGAAAKSATHMLDAAAQSACKSEEEAPKVPRTRSAIQRGGGGRKRKSVDAEENGDGILGTSVQTAKAGRGKDKAASDPAVEPESLLGGADSEKGVEEPASKDDAGPQGLESQRATPSRNSQEDHDEQVVLAQDAPSLPMITPGQEPGNAETARMQISAEHGTRDEIEEEPVGQADPNDLAMSFENKHEPIAASNALHEGSLHTSSPVPKDPPAESKMGVLTDNSMPTAEQSGAGLVEEQSAEAAPCTTEFEARNPVASRDNRNLDLCKQEASQEALPSKPEDEQPGLPDDQPLQAGHTCTIAITNSLESSHAANGSKGNNLTANLVSTIRSFLPSVKQAQEATQQPANGKKIIKVRALEAAEAARKREEEKAVERAKQRLELEKQRQERVKARQEEEHRKHAEEVKRREEIRYNREQEAALRRKEKEEAERRDREEKARKLEEFRQKRKEEAVTIGPVGSNQNNCKPQQIQGKHNVQNEILHTHNMDEKMSLSDAAKVKQVQPDVLQQVPVATSGLQVDLKPVAIPVLRPVQPSSQQHTATASTKHVPAGTGARPQVQLAPLKYGTAGNPSAHPAAVAVGSSLSSDVAPGCSVGPGLQQTQRAQSGPAQNYEISPYKSDFDSDDDRPKKPVPDWARGKQLLSQLAAQMYTDPDAIFQQHQKTCSLDEVFAHRDKPGKTDLNRRTSSGNWIDDRVTWKEEMNYKKAMGYM